MLKLKIIDGEKKAELSLDTPDDSDVRAILTGLFGIFRVNLPLMLQGNRPQSHVRTNANMQSINVKDTQLDLMDSIINQTEKPTNPQPAKTSATQSRPKVLQKVNDERTLTAPISEKFGDLLNQFIPTSPKEAELAKSDPDNPLITGIQIKHGAKCYRVAYDCPNPNCFHTGRRYMPENNEYVKCHRCGTKLKMRPATENGFPDRDEEGNFFVADEIYEG